MLKMCSGSEFGLPKKKVSEINLLPFRSWAKVTPVLKVLKKIRSLAKRSPWLQPLAPPYRALRRMWHRYFINPQNTSGITLIIPYSWAITGPQPRFYAYSQLPDCIPTLHIFTDEMLNQDPRPEPLDSFAFSTHPQKNLLVAQSDKKLPQGKYKILIVDPSTNNALWKSDLVIKSHTNYSDHFSSALDHRASFNQAKSEVNFSITTTVWNTSSAWLQELFDTIVSQGHRNFEWLILDNGCTNADTIECLDSLAKTDSRIQLFRVDKNIHIIGGNRYLFERASGEYIVPIDADDILYSDSLNLLARTIDDNDKPAIVYGDEQKVAPDGHPIEILWRQEWSPIFSLATCPCAHLMAFNRDIGGEAGVYTEDYARGSHDWDTVLRITGMGHRAKRVSEVLYGWRVHGESTASSGSAKPYAFNSQTANIRQALKRNGTSEKFHVRDIPESPGFYHLERRPVDPQPIEVIILSPSHSPKGSMEECVAAVHSHTEYPDWSTTIITDSNLSELVPPKEKVTFVQAEKEQLTAKLNEHIRNSKGLIALVGDHLRISNKYWLWDALGTMDLDPEIALVGGRIWHKEGQSLHLGYIGGMGGFFGSPLHGIKPNPMTHPLPVRRNVSGVYGSFVLLKPEAIGQTELFNGIDIESGLYGLDLSLRIQKLGKRVGWTPWMECVSTLFLQNPNFQQTELHRRVIQSHWDTITDDPFYNKYLSLDPARYGEMATPKEREEVLSQSITAKNSL